MIEKSTFPKNAMYATRGRLVELLNIRHRITVKKNGWKGTFHLGYRKRLTLLDEKVHKHCQWYVGRKYPDMPSMHFQRFGKGWLFLPNKWWEK